MDKMAKNSLVLPVIFALFCGLIPIPKGAWAITPVSKAAKIEPTKVLVLCASEESIQRDKYAMLINAFHKNIIGRRSTTTTSSQIQQYSPTFLVGEGQQLSLNQQTAENIVQAQLDPETIQTVVNASDCWSAGKNGFDAVVDEFCSLDFDVVEDVAGPYGRGGSNNENKVSSDHEGTTEGEDQHQMQSENNYRSATRSTTTTWTSLKVYKKPASNSVTPFVLKQIFDSCLKPGGFWYTSTDDPESEAFRNPDPAFTASKAALFFLENLWREGKISDTIEWQQWTLPEVFEFGRVRKQAGIFKRRDPLAQSDINTAENDDPTVDRRAAQEPRVLVALPSPAPAPRGSDEKPNWKRAALPLGDEVNETGEKAPVLPEILARDDELQEGVARTTTDLKENEGVHMKSLMPEQKSSTDTAGRGVDDPVPVVVPDIFKVGDERPHREDLLHVTRPEDESMITFNTSTSRKPAKKVLVLCADAESMAREKYKSLMQPFLVAPAAEDSKNVSKTTEAEMRDLDSVAPSEQVQYHYHAPAELLHDFQHYSPTFLVDEMEDLYHDKSLSDTTKESVQKFARGNQIVRAELHPATVAEVIRSTKCWTTNFVDHGRAVDETKNDYLYHVPQMDASEEQESFQVGGYYDAIVDEFCTKDYDAPPAADFTSNTTATATEAPGELLHHQSRSRSPRPRKNELREYEGLTPSVLKTVFDACLKPGGHFYTALDHPESDAFWKPAPNQQAVRVILSFLEDLWRRRQISDAIEWEMPEYENGDWVEEIEFARVEKLLLAGTTTAAEGSYDDKNDERKKEALNIPRGPDEEPNWRVAPYAKAAQDQHEAEGQLLQGEMKTPAVAEDHSALQVGSCENNNAGEHDQARGVSQHRDQGDEEPAVERSCHVTDSSSSTQTNASCSSNKKWSSSSSSHGARVRHLWNTVRTALRIF
ncbi:unnamed protein product [Amoebophrya sp. A120]|nr:unnamed protein product [Amoebophrya sp. A120]|eukprot:GSA120T00014702001.1